MFVTWLYSLIMISHLTCTFRMSAKKLRSTIHKLWNIRKYLDDTTCKSLVHALVTSHLDYCNALYFNLPAYLIEKLQKVQKGAARLVTGTSKYAHISPILYNLHWLPVRAAERGDRGYKCPGARGNLGARKIRSRKKYTRK